MRVLWHWKRVITFEIVLLSCILADYNISAAILDFWLLISSGSVIDSTIETFDPENIGIAVGSLFLASLEAEIPLGVVLPPSKQTSQK